MDAILVTHGHRSHLGKGLGSYTHFSHWPGDAASLSQKHGCKVFCVHEVSVYLQCHCGVSADNAIGMNFGGTVDIAGGWEATLLPSMHSSWCVRTRYVSVYLCVRACVCMAQRFVFLVLTLRSCNDGSPTGALLPGGGIAGGWMIKCPDGNVVYHAGDTNIFGDMKLFSEIWRPNVAIIPIGGHYCMVRARVSSIYLLFISLSISLSTHFSVFRLFPPWIYFPNSHSLSL